MNNKKRRRKNNKNGHKNNKEFKNNKDKDKEQDKDRGSNKKGTEQPETIKVTEETVIECLEIGGKDKLSSTHKNQCSRIAFHIQTHSTLTSFQKQ